LAGVTPEEEVGFDFLAARVAADTALTGVAEKVWCDADFEVSDDLVDVHGGLSF
jgi:alkylation response protein AidB-like acyl-CoA dehydrogenase